MLNWSAEYDWDCNIMQPKGCKQYMQYCLLLFVAQWIKLFSLGTVYCFGRKRKIRNTFGSLTAKHVWRKWSRRIEGTGNIEVSRERYLMQQSAAWPWTQFSSNHNSNRLIEATNPPCFLFQEWKYEAGVTSLIRISFRNLTNISHQLITFYLILYDRINVVPFPNPNKILRVERSYLVILTS